MLGGKQQIGQRLIGIDHVRVGLQRPPKIDLRRKYVAPVAKDDTEIVKRLGIVRIDVQDLLEQRLQPIGPAGFKGLCRLLQEGWNLCRVAPSGVRRTAWVAHALLSRFNARRKLDSADRHACLELASNCRYAANSGSAGTDARAGWLMNHEG